MRPSSENVFSSNGSPTLSSPAVSSVGLNSCVFSSAIAPSIASSALGRVQPFALGRGEDEVQDAALLGGELGLDQVGRLLRVRARNLELVLQAAAERPDREDQERDDPDPAEDDTPRMRGARAHPAGEPARRETFVGCAPIPVGPLVRGAFPRSGPSSHCPLVAAGLTQETGRARETHRPTVV